MPDKPSTVFDHVEFATRGKTINHLKSLSRRCRKLAKWIDRSVERTDASITMTNIMNSTADFLEVAAVGFGSHISILALSARNMFELNVRLRDVMRSDEQMKRWHGEAIIDKKQFLEGFLRLQTASDNTDAKGVLNSEIARLLSLQAKHNLPSKGSPPARNLSEGVGLVDEYDAFFKVFSKLIHPTSFLINDPKNADTEEHRSILVVQLQIYAGDNYGRVSEAVGYPDEIKAGKGKRRLH